MSLDARAWKARTIGWYVLLEDKPQAGPFLDIFAAVDWLHGAQGHSWHWAVKHDGWLLMEIRIAA